MATVEVEIPSTLTANSTYQWVEETDSYYWAVEIHFGLAHVATIPYTNSAGARVTGTQNDPSQKDVDEFVASRLRGLFLQ